jgi:Helix-turn-helix domain
MGLIFELSIPSTEKLVLLAMADHAREDGTGCYPSIKRLARKTSLTRRGVQKVLRRLCEGGFAKDTGKLSRYGTVEYTIDLERGCERRSLPLPPEVRTASHPGDEQENAGRANLTTGTSELHSHESLRNKSLTNNGIHLDSAHRHQDKKRNESDDDDFKLSRLLPQQSPRGSSSSEQYNQRVDKFREVILSKFQSRASSHFLNVALNLVDQRARDRGIRISSVNYLERALENFLNDKREVNSLAELLQQKQELRERRMPEFDAREHSERPDPELTEDVRFAIAESERTGKSADEILRARRELRTPMAANHINTVVTGALK